MKAILIDPAAKTVTQVEHNGNYKEIYKLIDCSCFTVIEVDPRNTLYLDDEGFLQAGKEVFYWQGYDAPLCGKALVLGFDRTNRFHWRCSGIGSRNALAKVTTPNDYRLKLWFYVPDDKLIQVCPDVAPLLK